MTMRANQQRGVGLLPALFVVVVGGLIGAALTPLLGAANQTTGLQIGQLRARSAAQTGLEWARYRIDRGANCPAGTLNLTAGALRGFRVAVTCTPTVHDDGGQPRTVRALTVFAQYAAYGSSDYVSYRVTAALVR